MRLLVFFVAGSLTGFLVLVAGRALLEPAVERASVGPVAAGALETPRVESRCEGLVQVDAPWLAASQEVSYSGSISVPAGLKRRVEFWKQIWSGLDNHAFVLVDPRLPWVVHGRVDCRDLYRPGTSEEQADQSCRLRIVQRLGEAKDRIRRRRKEEPKALLAAYGDRPRLARTAHRSLVLVEGRRQSLDRALGRARGSLGLMEKIFQGAGLPPELARLAIVESLFVTDAVSRSGAVGAYQFIASTAREYLMVHRDVDERRDPLRAAWAAARYLNKLTKRFGRLDLALTAYNVGPTRLARMIRRQKTRSLARLIRSARDDGFGFDGQNYFAQIAAVLQLSAAEKSRPTRDRAATFQLTRPMPLAQVAACLDLSPAEIAAGNPAFSRTVRQKGARIPRGYLVRAVPTPQIRRQAGLSASPGDSLVAGIQKKSPNTGPW